MKCKKCKRELPENSIYCCWCGAKQIKDRSISIPKPTRLASGGYAGRIQVNGRREYIKGSTEAEFYKKATALKLELTEMKNTPANMKLTEAIEDYLRQTETVLSPATIRGYSIIKKQIEKHTNKTIASTNWQALINQLAEEYAPKTVRNQWGLIQSSLKEKGIHVPDVKLPPAVKSERKFLQPDEIKTFLKAIEGKNIELTALLALHSLRASEILALNKDSIKDGVISVKGAVVPDKNNNYTYKPNNKTISSTRDIPVFIPRLKTLWEQGNISFPDPSNMRRDINRICRNNALPEVGVHGLRHTFCSLCYELDIDILTTCRLGGWSSPAVPQQIYTHLSQSRETKDIQTIKQFYSKTIKKP